MTKTHFKKLKNPNYVGSWDLADSEGKYHDKIVTITAVVKEMVHDGKGGQEECTVIRLKETKPMVANSTNLRMVAKLCQSPFIEDWVGKNICLTVQKVKAFGEVHDAIRVKAANLQPKPKPTITDERFEAALIALSEGKTTKESILLNFTLTQQQNERLSNQSIASK
jgi:hypothetical protein